MKEKEMDTKMRRVKMMSDKVGLCRIGISKDVQTW